MYTRYNNIDTKSNKSCANFLNKEIIGNKNFSITEYMQNATGGQNYDFKTRGIENKPVDMTEEQYKYRGMPIDGVSGLSNGNGLPTIASAKDIGNVGAGYEAGYNGIAWGLARFAFDALQSYQEGKLATEEQTTQLAEKVGYELGGKTLNEEHPLFKRIIPYYIGY